MKHKFNQIKVGISVGDYNGVGPEIIFKAISKKDYLEFFTPIIFASSKLVSLYKKHLDLKVNIHFIKDLDQVQFGQINVLECVDTDVELNFGIPTESSGTYALKSLTHLVEAAKNRKVDVIVTAPIDKKNTQTKDFNFNGHTGYLNHELKGDAAMFMVHENLKVGLVTEHVSVGQISETLNSELIKRKTIAVIKSLKVDYGIIKPKIAVLGLNPHNSDQGLMGDEEEKIIIPTIKDLQQSKNHVYGPFPADGFFMGDLFLKYDAIIAMYHDQGLIPFKTISQNEGVNYTAGLNVVRTSPDHGTAFDIAGKNKADEVSMVEAIFTALKIYNRRLENLKLIGERLQKQEMPEIKSRKSREYKKT